MSEQQHAYLKAMGIDVWVERTPVHLPAEDVTAEKVHKAQPESSVENESAPTATESVTQPVTTAESYNEIESLSWNELHSVVANCHNCDLADNRTKIIFGEGSQHASLMILGGAPNEEDEQQGHPFSGEAGSLLSAMIKAMGYQRSEVYITNLVKCTTLNNQDPSPAEVVACEGYLTRQIKLVQPDVILVLGSVTAQRFLKSKSTMSRLRGQLHFIDSIAIPVIVTYEPGYLLRSPNEKRKAWEDLQLAMKELSTKSNSTQ